MAFFAAAYTIASAYPVTIATASMTMGPFSALAVLAGVAINTIIVAKFMKKASEDLADKDINVTADVPLLKNRVRTIATYFWMFSNMTEEQTNIVTAWMSELIARFNDGSVKTYKKIITQDKKKYEFNLPETHFSATWTTNDNKQIKWHVTPQRRDGFIIEGDLSWISPEILKKLPKANM